MAKRKENKVWRQQSDASEPKPAVERVRTLSGTHRLDRAYCMVTDDRILASPSDDGTIRLWDFATGNATQVRGSMGGFYAVHLILVDALG